MGDPKKGTTTITLPGGQVISLRDWTDQELRATFDLTAGGRQSMWFPFAYDRSRQSGDGDGPYRESGRGRIEETGRIATVADFSCPQSGDVGLPRDWEFMAFGWRATVHGPKAVLDSEELASWLASTSGTLEYNHKSYATLALSDLVASSKPLEGPNTEGEATREGPPVENPPGSREWITKMVPGYFGPFLPIHFRMGLQYGVRVMCDDHTTLAALRSVLGRADTILKVRLHLRGLLCRTII